MQSTMRSSTKVDEDEDDGVFAEDWLEAAGFATTPPRATRCDHALDPTSLRTRLEALVDAQATSNGGDKTAAASPPLPSLREDSEAPTPPLLAANWSDDDLLREYAATPCETLVITFGGLTQGFPGVVTPGRAQHEFVGVCRRLGTPHALFVRDPFQSWYLRACLTEDGDVDPYASLIALLRHEVAVLRPTRIVTIGASMGGYAAIRAGAALGAHTTIAFGPQIFLHPDERRLLELPLAVMDPPLETLQRDAAAVGIQLEKQSLCVVLGKARALSAGEPTTSGTDVVMHVGDWPRGGDNLEARLLLEVLGRGKVYLHHKHGHNLAFGLRENGFLEPLLRAHLEPLGGAAPTSSSAFCSSSTGMDGVSVTVASIVARDNNGESPPTADGTPYVPPKSQSAEAKLEKLRRVNAGLSVWHDRGSA